MGKEPLCNLIFFHLRVRGSGGSSVHVIGGSENLKIFIRVQVSKYTKYHHGWMMPAQRPRRVRCTYMQSSFDRSVT